MLRSFLNRRNAVVAAAAAWFALAVPSSVVAESTVAHGAWNISRAEGNWGVHLTIEINTATSHDEWSNGVRWSEIDGLTESQLKSANGDVHFTVRRDAGSLHCNGTLADGTGGGPFSYEPNERFADELASRGIARPSGEQQFRMTLEDLSLGFVDALHRDGYPAPTPDMLVRMTEHGVTSDYLADLNAENARPAHLEDLIRMVDHGVRRGYIQQLAASGYHSLSSDELVEMVDHGVRPEFVREMVALGYHPTPAELVRMVDHGVTAAFAKRLHDKGYHASPDDMIRLRDAGY